MFLTKAKSTSKMKAKATLTEGKTTRKAKAKAAQNLPFLN